MPTYEYKCTKCNATEEHQRTVDDRDNLPNCKLCDILMDRIWQATPNNDVKTKYAMLYNNRKDYLYSKQEIVNGIKEFAKQFKI